ncbi:MAG: hypothetical protein J6B04_02320 [Clostridia bacterium]|nr:hypothetical protein [Clostridia bacterium]
MKNKFLALFLSVVALFSAIALSGCAKRLEVVVGDDGKTESVIFKISANVMEISPDSSVYDYMLALKEDGLFDFTSENSNFGQTILSVNGIENYVAENGLSGKSWMIYTDLTTLDDVVYSNAEYGTYEHDGKTLNSASYGVSGLPCIEGYTFALVYAEWSWN